MARPRPWRRGAYSTSNPLYCSKSPLPNTESPGGASQGKVTSGAASGGAPGGGFSEIQRGKRPCHRRATLTYPAPIRSARGTPATFKVNTLKAAAILHRVQWKQASPVGIKSSQPRKDQTPGLGKTFRANDFTVQGVRVTSGQLAEHRTLTVALVGQFQLSTPLKPRPAGQLAAAQEVDHWLVAPETLPEPARRFLKPQRYRTAPRHSHGLARRWLRPGNQYPSRETGRRWKLLVCTPLARLRNAGCSRFAVNDALWKFRVVGSSTGTPDNCNRRHRADPASRRRWTYFTVAGAAVFSRDAIQGLSWPRRVAQRIR